MQTSHRTAIRNLLLLGLPLGLSAQSSPAPDETSPRAANTPSSMNAASDDEVTPSRRERVRSDWSDFIGPQAGDYEITFGGGGLSNRDFDSSSGSVSGSFGYYFTDALELSARQSINYINPDGGDSGWGGSTRAALDHHLITDGRLRPFVGVNAGFLYGDGTDDTLSGGLEAGLKYYVQPRAFIFALAEYAWTFEDSEDADDNFDQGGFQWTLGIGLNF